MSTPPEWVAAWCNRYGRQLRVRPTTAQNGLDVALQRYRVIAACADSSVLVARAPWVRRDPHRIVAAIRDLPDDEPVLAEAVQIATQLDGVVGLVHAVPLAFGERSVGLDAALGHGRSTLAAAGAWVSAAAPGLTIEPCLLRVAPYELVGDGLDGDLLVLGGASRHLPNRLSLVAASALHHAPCPVLFVPRPT